MQGSQTASLLGHLLYFCLFQFPGGPGAFSCLFCTNPNPTPIPVSPKGSHRGPGQAHRGHYSCDLLLETLCAIHQAFIVHPLYTLCDGGRAYHFSSFTSLGNGILLPTCTADCEWIRSLDQAEARLRGLVYGVQPLPSPSPAAQSSGETKPPKLPQKLEVSLSTCTVRVWTHPHVLGRLGPGDGGDQRARRGHELSRWAGRPDSVAAVLLSCEVGTEDLSEVVLFLGA